MGVFGTDLRSLSLSSGSSGFKARGKMFEVKSTSGKLLFSADEQEVVVGAERLRVMGEWQAEPLGPHHQPPPRLPSCLGGLFRGLTEGAEST